MWAVGGSSSDGPKLKHAVKAESAGAICHANREDGASPSAAGSSGDNFWAALKVVPSKEFNPEGDFQNSDTAYMESDDTVWTNAGGTVQEVTADQLAAITNNSAHSQGGAGGTSSSSSSGSSSSGTSTGSGGGGGSSTAPDTPSPAVPTTTGGAGPAIPLQENLLEELKQLQPLPKIHYYWYVSSDFLSNRNNEVMYELARITHSVCVSGEWVNAAEIENAVYVCARVNKDRPANRCSIGVTYGPWIRKFKGSDPRVKDRSYYDEIDQFESRMELVKQWFNKSNTKYGTYVEIGAVLLDAERFYRQPHPYAPVIPPSEYTEWNTALCAALDVIHKKALELFPNNIRIEWYNRGIQTEDGKTFHQTVYFTGSEIMPTCSCALYTVADLDRMRNTFIKTCDYAGTKNVNDVTPWVALAGGYYKPGVKKGYTWDWDYDVQKSYTLGAELNDFCIGERPEGYPDYGRAKIVIFWPAPFHSWSPSWGKHFIEYCKGAASANSQQIPVQ
jgi:hypothetical protein